jgi:AcrR family transcriptional regulator
MARPRSNISERIREAACLRFLADGVDGASLRAIAAQAKTSIGMVYYYYPSKEELFFAVVDQAYVKLVQDLSLALAPERSVEQRLLGFYERLGALSDAELRVLRLVLCELLKSTDRFERLAERFQSGHVALIAQAVRQAFSEGTFAAGRHPLLAMVSLVSLAGLAQTVARLAGSRSPFPGAPSGAQLSAELVDVLLHGLSNPPAAKTQQQRLDTPRALPGAGKGGS